MTTWTWEDLGLVKIPWCCGVWEGATAGCSDAMLLFPLSGSLPSVKPPHLGRCVDAWDVGQEILESWLCQKAWSLILKNFCQNHRRLTPVAASVPASNCVTYRRCCFAPPSGQNLQGLFFLNFSRFLFEAFVCLFSTAFSQSEPILVSFSQF